MIVPPSLDAFQSFFSFYCFIQYSHFQMYVNYDCVLITKKEQLYFTRLFLHQLQVTKE